MIKIVVLALIIACQAGVGFCESNEIHSLKVIKQTSNFVIFELKYYYSGDHGDKAELTAWPLPPGYWGSSVVSLISGEHTSQLTVTLGLKVSKEVSSDSIEFLYISDGGPPFYKKSSLLRKSGRIRLNKRQCIA